MSENAFFWIAGIFALIVGAIGGAFWRHILEDAKVRERVATLEADSKQTKEEVKSLRERWHDIRDTTVRDTWTMLQDRFEKFREEIRGWFK